MKKIYSTAFSIFFFAVSLFAQTSGELTVTVTTSTTGGNYSPKNIVAIWIEDDAGNFVKTLLAYAQTRKTHLNTWQASTTAAGSPYNTVDAITGATKSSHGTRTCYWNASDVDGEIVIDGTYKIWMELTDKNSTGNFSSFSFVKGDQPEAVIPMGVPSFSAISISWIPTSTGIALNTNGDNIMIHPNPTNGNFTIVGNSIIDVEIRNIEGILMYSGNSEQANLANQPNGLYIVKIKSENNTVIKKVIKQ